MVCVSRSITLETPARQEFFDVTDVLVDFVQGSGVCDGVAIAYSQHTSCCVLLQEESEDTTYYGTQLLLQDTLNVFADGSHENLVGQMTSAAITNADKAIAASTAALKKASR